MKRLLIIDDEHHIVNWLAELFDSHFDIELAIFKCYSGQEALAILKNTKIDVVLLDIKMPGLDGLQVSEKILSNWPSCRIIFLTGYNNFDYIYYANKHKHISYLLKTEPDEVIMQTVSDAFSAIEMEQQQFLNTLQTSVNEKLTKHFIHQNYLRNVFQDSKTQLAVPSDFPLNLSQPIILLYIHIISYKGTTSFFSTSDAIYHSIQILEQILYKKLQYSLLEYDQHTILCFLQPPQLNEESVFENSLVYLKECFDDFIAFYNKNNYETMLLLYHQILPFEKSYEAFGSMYKYMALNSLLNHQVPCGTIFKEISTDRYPEQINEPLYLSSLETQLNEMPFYLNKGEYKHFAHLIKKTKFYCKDIKSMHYFPVIGIYHKISSMLISYVSRHNLTETIAYKIELYPLYYTSNFSNWKEAFEYLERLTDIIFQTQKNKPSDTNLVLINTIKDYIASHLSQNLTLTLLSDLVNYNSSYVSRVFKQETGMKLSDYITFSRIEKAKELLRFTDDSIRNISVQVDFDTTQYFSMVFKKQTNLTPSDFRIYNITENPQKN